MHSSSRSRSPFGFHSCNFDINRPTSPALQRDDATAHQSNSHSVVFLLVVGALLIGGVASFLGVLKGKDIEARPQDRCQKLTRSVLGGVYSDQFAPFLPDFPKDLKASEGRFIGKPIDFLILKGMDDHHITKSSSSKSRRATHSSQAMNALCATRSRPSASAEYRVDRDISAIPAPNLPKQKT